MWRPDGVIFEFFPSPYTMKPQGTLKRPFLEPKMNLRCTLKEILKEPEGKPPLKEAFLHEPLKEP